MQGSTHNSSHKSFLIAVALAVIFVLSTSSIFAQPDTSEWVCEFCPFEDGYRADYEAGATIVTENEARFGNASGYEEDGGYINLDGEGAVAKNNYRANWLVKDLGLDSRSLEFEGGELGRYDVRVAYSELPQHVFDTTRTVFGASTADTLSLPSGWVSAPATSGFSALAGSLAANDIESERKTVEIGGRYVASSRYRVSAQYRRQTRDGIDITSGAYFTQASQLPRPLAYETDEIDVSLRYLGSKVQLKLGYYASVFDDSNTALNWQNPFTAPAGGEFARLAQAPDNSFHQLAVSGSYRFGAYDTVLNFSAASGRIEQDDDLLPYTSNAQLSVGALPRTRLDAEVQTTNVGLKLSSRPSDRIRLRASYRFDDRDNNTPTESWTRVITDSFNSGEVETNTAYSFERSRLKLSADYELRPTLLLSAGYDRNEHDRNFQEVAQQTEESGWGKVRWRPTAMINVHLKAGTTEREVDRYDETLAATLGQNPLLRKYNLAYRFRKFGELKVSASLADSPLSLTASVMYADDDYSQSALGVTKDEDIMVSADLNWALSENTSLYVFGSYEDIEAEQSGSELFAAPDWRAANEDTFSTLGAGVRVRAIAENIDLNLDYTRSDGSSEITVFSTGQGASQFPDLESQLDSLRMRLIWRRTERHEVTFRLQYERFDSADWALQGVGPATIPTILTMGAEPYDYDVFLIGVGFRYFIGDRSPTF